MFKKILLSMLLILFAIATYAYEISSWQILNNTTLPTRENPGVITYNGQIYVIAGYNATDGYFNDVWRSSNGINWYANTRNAQFEGRTNMAVYNHNNRLWVVGGTNTSTAFADAWYSTNNGVSWNAATLNAQYLPRTSFWGYTTHKGYMYFTSGNVSGTYPKEVWRSSNGVSWEGVTLNASFDGGEYGALVSDGTNLYQFGGYSTVVGDVTNKVWKSVDDGITWTLLGTANWSARQGFAHGYLNGRIWVTSGYGSSTYYQDTWYSDDWINWTQDLDALNTMTNLGSTIFLNKWLTIGGYNGTTYDNSVIMANIPLGTSTVTGTPTYTYTATFTHTFTNTSTDTSIVTDTPTNTATFTPIWTQQSSIIVSNLTPQLTQIPYPTGIAIISEPTPEWTQPIPLATIWVSMINWPTLVPTLTATNTATQTPTAAITPYATYQPIIRYVASESDGYKNGMKIEFNKVTGVGDYSGIIYNLRVKDLMYPSNIYSVNLSNSIDTTNATSGWITYNLTNLRYNYCYEIYLDINHPSWAATISATPITLCPYETPTPFAGTPTASNTPDCSPPTATPTPQVTIVQTVTGLVAFFNPTAQPTNAIVDLTGSGYSWGSVSGVSATVRSLDGIFGWNTNAVTAGDNNAGLLYVTNTASTLFIQELYTATGAGDRQVLVRGGTATTGTWYASWITTSWYSATYANFNALAPFDFTANRWYRRTISYDYKPGTATRVNEYIVVDTVTNTISSAQSNSAVRLSLTPPYIAVWALDTRGTGGITGFITAHNLIAKSRYIKVVLPAIDYKVEILDSSDTEILCAETDVSGIAIMDGINFKWGDFMGKIRITTPNGWVYTSDLMAICVGDVFTLTLI